MANNFTIPSIFTAVDKFTAPIEKMQRKLGQFGGEGDAAAARVERRFRKLGEASQRVAKQTFIAGAAIAAPLVLAGNEAVKYEDKLADVAKTTGLQGSELQNFSDALLKLSGDTRTSIDDLLKIGEIGGQLGIAKNELVPFTDAVNKFNVAIGADFSGGVEEAVSSIGNIKTLFAETRKIKIDDAILRVGSAINDLGAQGSATSANVTDFILRIGALPDALKPTVTQAAALGAFFEESGLNAEIAAGGLTRLLLVAGKNLPEFAKQMKISEQAAADLLKNNPSAFLKQFSTSLNGLAPDELAKKLHKMDIGTQESIKVIGALGAGMQRFEALSEISNNAFAKGTSLTEEYAKKNETTAAKIAKAQNNLKAFTILVGSELLPLMTDLITKTIGVLKSFVSWAKENPRLFKGIIYGTVALSAFMFTVSAVASVVTLVSNLMLIWTSLTRAYVVVQWALNAAMTANPIGLIIAGIAALIAVVAVAIVKYNEWGAALLFLTGPLGFVVNLIQSFRRNWDGIVESFSSGGILSGIKMIGATIYDAILMPIQQIAKLIAELTGLERAQNVVKNIEAQRAALGLNVNTDESGQPLAKPVVSTKAAEQEAAVQRSETTQRQDVNINIRDKAGVAEMASNTNNIVPVKLSTTMGF